MPRRRTSPQPSDETIRMVVVEPQPLLGVGIREVLDRENDIEVVGQVHSAEEALPVVDETAPDVILVKAAPAESAEAEAARQLHRESPDSPMVVLGGDGDDASLVGALELGATAHVAEGAEPAELVATIRRVAEGDDPLKDEISARPDLLDKIVDVVRDSIAAERSPANPLTPRELEILRLVAAGWRNRDIADSLGLSTQTVKNHLTTILHKLGVPNRTRAVTYAARQGWLELREVPAGARR